MAKLVLVGKREVIRKMHKSIFSITIFTLCLSLSSCFKNTQETKLSDFDKDILIQSTKMFSQLLGKDTIRASYVRQDEKSSKRHKEAIDEWESLKEQEKDKILSSDHSTPTKRIIYQCIKHDILEEIEFKKSGVLFSEIIYYVNKGDSLASFLIFEDPVEKTKWAGVHYLFKKTDRHYRLNSFKEVGSGWEEKPNSNIED